MQQKAIFLVGVAGTLWALASTPVPDEAASPGIGGMGETPRTSFVDSRAEPSDDSGGDETVIQRGATGQFHLTARVEGQEADFLVDTGADVVALTVGEAERIGLAIDPGSFRPITETASGTGNGTLVRLASFEVAGAELRNVDAIVLEGLSTNLLGQNVLSQLGSVNLEGNRMVIRR